MDYPDGGVGNRVYLRKIADGIRGGIRHSVLPYLVTMRLSSTPAITQTHSEGRPRINDPNVLNDYHSILIPKAIEYSAGILDYFFRGRLDVCMTPGPVAGPHSLTIVNRSGQGFQGGSFKLFWDDANGVRTAIAPPAFNPVYGTSLPNNGSITATFTPPAGNVSAYVLVYQGTIGANGSTPPAPLDPVEYDVAAGKGLAIAAKRFICQDGPGESISSTEFLNGTWVNDGQITAVVDANARATRLAGRYRLTYLSGHASTFTPAVCGLHAPDTCGDCTANLIYTATTFPPNFTPFPGGVLEQEVRCPITSCIFDNRPLTANAAHVEQITSRTPYVLSCHNGGAIGPLVRELSACQNSNPTAEGGTFSPGNITYTVERLSFRHVNESAGITTLRVKDFASVAPSLLPCAGCENNSTLPPWNGEIPLDQIDPCGSFIRWSTEDPFTFDATSAINGFGVLVSVWASGGSPATGWRIEISCITPSGSVNRLWYGFKSRGYTPRGSYLPDPTAPGCAAGNLCCITIE